MSKQRLVLENGMIFSGNRFGSLKNMTGEVVFYNGITGYQEIISDPVHAGKIIVMTHPLIGNYGINRDDFEALDPCINGLIVKEVCHYPSNFRADESLDNFFKAHDIPALTAVDTRKLVKHIRKEGTMNAAIVDSENNPEFVFKQFEQSTQAKELNLVEQVSTVKPYIIPGRGKRIIIIDLGIKHGILRELTKRNCHITVVPYHYEYEKIMRLKPEGVLLSNGPGNPRMIPETVNTIQRLFGSVPIFGIGLGHLLLALASGAEIEALPYGQVGNYPVRNIQENKAYLVAKSHTYTVTSKSLAKTDLKETYKGLNHDSVEGLQHKQLPVFSVQFNPEGSPGPEDNTYLFDMFLQQVHQFLKKQGGRQ